MSTYGSSGSGQEPPTDPWTDQNQTVPVHPASPSPQVNPVPPGSVPPYSGQPSSAPPYAAPPNSAPPYSGPTYAAPQGPAAQGSVPQNPPPTFQPGQAQPAVPQPPYNQYQQPQYQPSQYPANQYQYPAEQYQPSQYPPNQYQSHQYNQGYEQAAPPADYGDPGWQAPVRKRNTAVIVLSILLAVVVVAGIGVGAYLLTHKGTSTVEAIPQQGQCVRSNNQPEPNTTVSVVTCGPGVFKVLKTVTATDQVTACNGVAGMTNIFHFTATNGSLSDSYVLCLGASS